MTTAPSSTSTASRSLNSVAVYCGSNRGLDPGFANAAVNLGNVLAERQIGLVYGGGHVGLMGVIADAVLQNGGTVHGVITTALEEKEVAHQGLSKLDVVETMHERKAIMADAADAFIMLPGGLGTFDEFFEVATWTQLGIQSKPCGVLNVNGYFDELLALLDKATAEGFVRIFHRDIIIIETDPDRLLDQLGAWSQQ
jgi:uncharacterized protein (TIGR00730 family)